MRMRIRTRIKIRIRRIIIIAAYLLIPALTLIGKLVRVTAY